MKRLFLAAMALALSACGTTTGVTPPRAIPVSPAAVVNQTKLDESGALAITLAYTGARRSATLGQGTSTVEGEKLG